MNAPFCVSWLFQILMNVKGTHARTGVFAQIWLPTTPVTAQESTWEGTVNTVSTHHFNIIIRTFFFSIFFLTFTTINSASATPDAQRYFLMGNEHH